MSRKALLNKDRSKQRVKNVIESKGKESCETEL